MTSISFKHSERVERLLRDIVLEPLSSDHLEDVAKLHYGLLPWSFNGQFGEAHIIDLYKALGNSSHFFGYVYYRDGHLLGFVTATTDYRDTRNHLLGVYRKKLFKMLWIFLCHPAYLLAALESRFLVPRVFRRYGTHAEWLTFVTDTTTGTLGPLVAMRLIDAVREHFFSVGVGCYMAQGFKDNPPAMRMYEKLGWRIVATLPMHNIYYYPTGIQTADTGKS
jgi:GNAT superfamily N-acetyltransferase